MPWILTDGGAYPSRHPCDTDVSLVVRKAERGPEDSQGHGGDLGWAAGPVTRLELSPV